MKNKLNIASSEQQIQISQQQDSLSQIPSSSNKPHKDLIQKYYDLKCCEICQDNRGSRTMLLCDRCDDGYHIECLNAKKNLKEVQQWICPECQKDQMIFNQENRNIQIQNNLQIVKNCTKCKVLLDQPQKLNYLQHRSNGLQKDFFILNQFKSNKCLYCSKFFHDSCFNFRQNALNCQDCQKKIRRQCPKGHKHFIQYYEKIAQIYKNDNYLTLTPLIEIKKTKRFSKLNLKVPSPVTNWQLITQYEASIYYAFKTKHLNFIEDQIYQNAQTMALNNSLNDATQIYSLHQDDQRTFQQFKINVANGLIGPYQIKQDKIKGFHILSTDFIERMTIICQYVGQVMGNRKSLFYDENDSIFMLIKSISSKKSLDIVPNKFSNLSRFFSGINNTDKNAKKLINIQTIRFNYKGRVRIIFYASKNIQAGDLLYFDYNGSPFNQYPTENFTH